MVTCAAYRCAAVLSRTVSGDPQGAAAVAVAGDAEVDSGGDVGVAEGARQVVAHLVADGNRGGQVGGGVDGDRQLQGPATLGAC